MIVKHLTLNMIESKTTYAVEGIINTTSITIDDVIKVTCKLSNEGMQSDYFVYATNPEELILPGTYNEVRDFIIQLHYEGNLTNEQYDDLRRFLNSCYMY